MNKLIFTALLAITLVGCASGGSNSASFGEYKSGTQVTTEQLAKVKAGMSESEVVAILGQPTKKEPLRDKEVWSYPYTHVSYFSNTSETTLVEFNSKGLVLTAYKAGGVKEKTGNPMIDAANGVK